MNLLPLRFRLPRAARRLFGWPSLRPGQYRPMRALMKGRDVLVVLPTGGGKSAVYQLPGALRRGPDRGDLPAAGAAGGSDRPA